VQRCLAYSKPLRRWRPSTSQSLKSHIPQAFQPFLLQHVTPPGVRQGDGRLATVGPPADEGQCPEPLATDERRAQRLATTRQQRDRKVGPAHQRVGQGEAVKAALARCLGDDGIAGQQLHQLGMHLHAHRVVPAGDIRDRPWQWSTQAAVGGRQLTLDLADVPAHAVQCTVDVSTREAPRLADLPYQQERQQVTVCRQRIDRLCHPAPTLVEVHLTPGPMFFASAGDGLHGGVEVDARRAGNRSAVDRSDVIARDADPSPLTVNQVAQPIGFECLRGYLLATGVGLPPRRSTLQRSGSCAERLTMSPGFSAPKRPRSRPGQRCGAQPDR